MTSRWRCGILPPTHGGTFIPEILDAGTVLVLLLAGANSGPFTVRRRETADSGPCAGGGRAQKPRTAGPRAGDEPIAPRAGPAIAQRGGADESAGGDLPASQPGISSLPDTERVRRALRADAGGLCGGHPFRANQRADRDGDASEPLAGGCDRKSFRRGTRAACAAQFLPASAREPEFFRAGHRTHGGGDAAGVSRQRTG